LDTRLYILGGLAILFVSLLVYTVASLARLRSVSRRAGAQSSADDDDDAPGAYVGELEVFSTLFETPSDVGLDVPGTAEAVAEAEVVTELPPPQTPLPAESSAPATRTELKLPLAPSPVIPPAAPAPSPAPAPAPVVAQASPAVTPSVPAERPQAPPIQSPSPVSRSQTPDYLPLAPVELYFAGFDGPVGVRRGTRTHAEFERLATLMLRDLRTAERRG
jgi:hypothetical protein